MYTQGSKKYSKDSEISLEIKRQIFHLVAISLWLVPVLYFPYLLTLLLMAAVVLLNLLVVLKKQPFYGFFSFLLDRLEREKNADKPAIQALYGNSGILLSFLLFAEDSWAGITVLAVGDSLSTLFGKLIGKTPLPLNNQKSWEGSIAFFVGTFLVLSAFLPYEKALLLSLIGTLTEALSVKIDDNLTLPLVVSSVYRFM